jgi:O-antigen ligase
VGDLRRSDATPVLSFLLVLLLALPSRLVVGPLGAAGTPAEILGIVLLLWWVNAQLFLSQASSSKSALARHSVGVYAAAALISYVVAMTRPIVALEVRSADRALLSLCAWAGILLVTAEGVGTIERLDALLRRVCAGVSVVAGLGVFQFFSGRDITQLIVVPGLVPNNDYVTLLSRSGFNRPSATAIHPIEFGTVLAIVLPIAVHYALCSSGRGRSWRWFGVALIGLGIPMSVSRSAILGAIVAGVIVLPTWPSRQRHRGYVVLLVFALVVKLFVHGLLGTLLGLFTGISSSDSSTTSRTGSYHLVGEYLSQHPIFGRGVGTFLPSYHILDNQYLGTLLELGVAGVLALLALLLIAVYSAWRGAQVATNATTCDLGYCLAASISAATVCLGTFDGLSFPMFTSLMMLLIGCCHALLRLCLQKHPGTVFRSTVFL